jgi:hypothetical protein
MLHVVRRASVTLALAGTLVAISLTPAQAAGAPPQVTGLTSSTQSWAAKTVLIKWKAIAGVTYTAKYSTSTSFTNATYKNVTSASSNLTGIQPGHTYYAVVRAVKGSSVGAYSARLSFSLTAGYTGLFSSVSARPASNGMTISWGAAPYATDYRVVSSAGPNPNRRPDYWVLGLQPGDEIANDHWHGCHSHQDGLRKPDLCPRRGEEHDQTVHERPAVEAGRGVADTDGPR